MTYDIHKAAEERLHFYVNTAEQFQEDWYNNNIAKYIDYEG